VLARHPFVNVMRHIANLEVLMPVEKIKNCPFCGKTPSWFQGIDGGNWNCIGHRHMVQYCGANRASALRAWNRRAKLVEVVNTAHNRRSTNSGGE